MYQRLIRYRARPGQADANARLVEAVYAELHRTRPDGVSYATFRLRALGGRSRHDRVKFGAGDRADRCGGV